MVAYKQKEEGILVDGEVVQANRGSFLVEVKQNDKKTIVNARLSGKMRANSIKIVVGDKVQLELSPYDLTRGRITYRSK